MKHFLNEQPEGLLTATKNFGPSPWRKINRVTKAGIWMQNRSHGPTAKSAAMGKFEAKQWFSPDPRLSPDLFAC